MTDIKNGQCIQIKQVLHMNDLYRSQSYTTIVYSAESGLEYKCNHRQVFCEMLETVTFEITIWATGSNKLKEF